MAFSSASNSNKTISTTLNVSINISLNASQSVHRSGSRNSASAGGGGGGEDILPKLKTLVSLDDDWIAVKSLSQTNVNTDNLFANKNDEIINIVSISVEKEKISIVTREHNRLVTDDENTKQWYGIYSVEQLYSIHQRMCELDSSLNDIYPAELRPIKGILSTYFTNKLNYRKNSENDLLNDDLQDNELCNSFVLYLNKAFNSLGKRLFIDILFNDINIDQYFEIYSEFNLKRIQSQIDKAKMQLFPTRQYQQSTTSTSNSIIIPTPTNNIKQATNVKQTLNASLNEILKKQNEEIEQQHKLLLKQQLFSTLKHIINAYANDDNHVENLFNLYAEYYKNYLKPFVDKLSLAQANLSKYTTKLTNQEKSSRSFSNQFTVDALVELRSNVNRINCEIYELKNKIDSKSIEYHQKLIDLNGKLLNKLKADREKFLQPSLNLNLTGLFDVFTKKRKEKIDNEISTKKLQLYDIQLSLNERKRENTDQEDSKVFLTKQIIKIKMQQFSEEEIVLKRNLNVLTENDNMQLKEDQLKHLLKDSDSSFNYLSELKIDEIKEIISKIDLNNYATLNDYDEYDEEEDDDDEYDDSKFHDAYDDPLALLQEEAKEKQLKNNEIITIKKKITEIGSKKSSLRISLSKLFETEKIKQQEIDTEKLNETSEKLSQTFVVKSPAMKKQEDEEQRKENLENRKKAIQRIKEHKIKHSKDTMCSSTDSLASSTSLSTAKQTSKTLVVKKPYVPKSQQRILIPPASQIKPRQSQPRKPMKKPSINPIDESKLDDGEIASSNLLPSNSMSDSDVFKFKPNTSYVSMNQDLIKCDDHVISISATLPPPPPPLPSFLNQTTSTSSNNISKALPPPPPPPPPPPLPQAFLISSPLMTSSTISSSSQEPTQCLPVLPPSPRLPPLLFSSETFKAELQKAKTVQKPLSTQSPNENTCSGSNSSNKSFDFNEIKTFKFKKLERKEPRLPLVTSQNPREMLMDEIRSNAGGNKLKKVSSSDKKSKHMKFNTDNYENNSGGSDLFRDLNHILSQRSQYFKKDEEDESSDDEGSWSGYVEN